MNNTTEETDRAQLAQLLRDNLAPRDYATAVMLIAQLLSTRSTPVTDEMRDWWHGHARPPGDFLTVQEASLRAGVAETSIHSWLANIEGLGFGVGCSHPRWWVDAAVLEELIRLRQLGGNWLRYASIERPLMRIVGCDPGLGEQSALSDTGEDKAARPVSTIALPGRENS